MQTAYGDVMADRRRTRGEQWSGMYRNPAFDYERHQDDLAILIGDVRRFMRIGLTIVVVFATMLAVSGRFVASLNLLMIVGAPLLVIALVGEALEFWSRRGEPHDDAGARTIFDQLEQFDHQHPPGHRPRTR